MSSGLPLISRLLAFSIPSKIKPPHPVFFNSPAKIIPGPVIFFSFPAIIIPLPVFLFSIPAKIIPLPVFLFSIPAKIIHTPSVFFEYPGTRISEQLYTDKIDKKNLFKKNFDPGVDFFFMTVHFLLRDGLTCINLYTGTH